MELGKNIAKIRKDNNLTQDDFAEKYFVTRQTISNWEIGKSYPDLETLVKISNDFNISLDILLKEDNKMVQEIDKGVKGARKYKNILKYIIIFISIIILAFLVYLAMYLHFEKKVMNKFSEIAEKYDLKQDNVNMYMFKKGDSIIYSTIPEPIPKILDFKLDYKEKTLNCTIITGEDLKDNNGNGTGWSSEIQINWTNDGKVYIDAYACEDRSNYIGSLKDSKGNECDYYANVGHYEVYDYDGYSLNYDNELLKKLGIDRDTIREAIIQGTSIYKDLYK